MRVYLDQNKWIELLKARHGRGESSPAIRRVLDRLTERRPPGLEVPLTAVHAVEVTRIGDELRRERLAQLMIEISGGLGLLRSQAVHPLEVEYVFAQALGIPCRPVRASVVGVGLPWVMGTPMKHSGGTEETRRMADELLYSAEAVLLGLQCKAKPVGEHEAVFLQSIAQERDRIHASRMTRARMVAEWFGSHSVRVQHRAAIVAVCMGLNLTETQLRTIAALNPDSPEFIQRIPTQMVLAAIAVDRDRQWQRKTQRNDVYDAEFMAVAVPYCDVAIVERHVGALARRNRLSERLGCRVLSSLDTLDVILAEPQ